MSFLIRNITGSPGSDVELVDLGITIPAGTDFDMRFEPPMAVASSGDVDGDLRNAVTTDKLIVLDPLDGVTPLSKAKSIELLQAHNDPHFGIRGGALNQLDDVDTSGGSVNDVLQLNGVGTFVAVSPDDIVNDATNAVNNAIANLFQSGTDTTFTAVGSPVTAVQINVDDVFLRNTGDTLDSGTLTIASGATVSFPSGSILTILDGANVTVETPTGGFTDPLGLINKSYVDSIAAGLDPKESVRVASTVDVGGVFSAGSPIGPTDTITGAAGVIDDITLVVDDRVLVKDQSDLKQNGIYVVTAVNAGSPVTVDLQRADDQNGNPSSEVSAGNFTHVEQGTANINTKWVVTGDGVLTLGVDDINWVLFSGPDTLIADVGLVRTGNTIALDISPTEVTSATPEFGDSIAFHDADGATQSPTNTQTYGATFQDVVNALDVPHNITADGFIARTADDTYASRTITAAGAGDRDGIEVLNGDGVAGDPTIGLDIETLPFRGAVSTTDRVPVYDVSTDTNVFYTVSDIATALATVNSFETWAGAGNTTGDPSIVADSPTDTVTLEGGTGININFGGAGSPTPDQVRFELSFAAIPLGGSPNVVDPTDDIIINNGGTIVQASLQEVIDGLGLSTTDELVKVSANDTTAGFLNGKLVSGVHTTLTENNDGGNETLTIDVDPSTINIEDLGNVVLVGSPAPVDGDVLIFDSGLNQWKNTPSTTLFNICTLPAGTIATLDPTDEIAVCDSGTTVRFSFSDIFNKLDVVNGVTGTGLIIRTGGSPDTYATRSIVESTNAGEQGAQVNNGDGTAGDIEIGVDINNLANSADDLVATDEVIVYDGTDNVSMSGQQVADGVATVLNLPDLEIRIINGQPIVTYTDTTRGGGSPPAGKRLSTDMLQFEWTDDKVGDNEWIDIGNALDAVAGHVMPFDCTIVGVVALTVDAKGLGKDFTWFKDGVSQGTLFSFAAVSGETEVVTTTLDLDVDQGEKIRIRSAGGGTIEDVVITLYVRLRAS